MGVVFNIVSRTRDTPSPSTTTTSRTSWWTTPPPLLSQQFPFAPLKNTRKLFPIRLNREIQFTLLFRFPHWLARWPSCLCVCSVYRLVLSTTDTILLFAAESFIDREIRGTAVSSVTKSHGKGARRWLDLPHVSHRVHEFRVSVTQVRSVPIIIA